MNWTPKLTRDGSFTFFSTAFGESFHSGQGAKSEAFAKFARVTNLVDRSQQPTLRLLDVCYGLGYNSAAAIETIWQSNPHCNIELYALELDNTVAIGATMPALLDSWTLEVQEILKELATTQGVQREYLTAHLLIGDARSTIQELSQRGFQADAIFFDPFSPRKCPELWTVEFFKAVGLCLALDGILATYSRSASVRSAMLLAGFAIGSIPVGSNAAPGEWSQGTVAAHPGMRQMPMLSEMEYDHLETRAGVAYRDPSLVGTQVEILARYEQDQSLDGLRSTSSWRKKWGL